jgi:hypothetical protein
VITVPSHMKKDNPKAALKPHPRRQRRNPAATSSSPAAGNTALYPLLQRVNTYLLRWIRKKYRVGMKQAILRLAEGYALAPRYFAHWALTPPPACR